jgi:peptidoglycan/LPS O-acetylase OafA/YrhL
MQNTAFSDSKGHYEILDGLRGVAAIMVLLFHIFETFTMGEHLHQKYINHGYLAVDFFFVLSGFVIGYAYDDRWKGMTLGNFFKRRFIRLHPMIIIGMVIGALGYYLNASPVVFPLIAHVPVWKMLLIMLIGFTLLPVIPSMDIRGWSEMYPLDSPAWSLFYEYVANILYALFIRKLSNKILAVLVFIFGCVLIHFTVTSPMGEVSGGWSLNPGHIRIGLSRLLYPFFAGLLLSRVIKPGQLKYAFLWCSIMVIAALSIPRIGGTEHIWWNGLYESCVIIFIFPLIVYMGSSGKVEGKTASKICKFLGDISYPLYLTHYPLIYWFTGWVVDNHVSLENAIPVAILIVVASIVIAYLSLRLYDIPVRKWLSKRFVAPKR